MKIVFLTKLDVEQVQDSDHPTWKLINPFTVAVDNTSYTVPPGFITDFASIPRIVPFYDLLGNEFSKPACIHDWLYSTSSPVVTQQFADNVLFNAMIADGYSYFKAWSVWTGVHFFGSQFFRKSPDSNA